MDLSVSILSIKDNIRKNIEELIQYDVDYLHLDIMDGIFVPNKTWNVEQIKKILPNDSTRLDVHLMVNDIKNYITDFITINPYYITFHLEATNNPKKIIELIKSYDIKVGISIKPNTPVLDLIPYLKDIDLVLVMSVEPGFGGQKFLINSKNKIDELYNLRSKYNYNYVIEADGGINNETINYCNNCDIVVVGSYITNNNYEESIKTLNLKKKKHV